MQSSNRSPRVEEPFRRALLRNVTIAAGVGLVFALLRRDSRELVPVTILALWFSLGGHYVELVFLNGVRNWLPAHRLTHVLVRLAVWWCAGVILSACMRATAQLFSLHAPPLWPWWFGGLSFIGIELAVHAALAARNRASFYDGRG